MAAPAFLIRLVLAAVVLAAAPWNVAARAQANTPAVPEAGPRTDSCPGLVASLRPPVVPAAAEAPGSDEVRITYVGHATFMIESPKLVRIATDYNDYVRPLTLPDIATMNHAHSTHFTDRPDPDIKFVLRGWRNDGAPANHDLTYADVRVRSVATNIRDWNGGTEKNGNSIFVFEVGHLCIAHLGHLHHTLTPQQLEDIGHVDVLLVPVDGGYTLDLDGMVEVVRAIKAPLMVPMHYFNSSTLRRFLNLVSQDYDVEFAATPTVVVSKATLPAKGRFLVLPGR
jgi:L-ascorbate metabolism protein UlaG (beta-lactamase superfamily)